MKKQTTLSLIMTASVAMMATGCSNEPSYYSYGRSNTYPHRAAQFRSNPAPVYRTEHVSYGQNNNAQETIGSGELKALLALGALLIAPEAILGEGLLEAGAAAEVVEGVEATEAAVSADEGFLLQQRVRQQAEKAIAEKAVQDAAIERAAARQAAPRLY